MNNLKYGMLWISVLKITIEKGKYRGGQSSILSFGYRNYGIASTMQHITVSYTFKV